MVKRVLTGNKIISRQRIRLYHCCTATYRTSDITIYIHARAGNKGKRQEERRKQLTLLQINVHSFYDDHKIGEKESTHEELALISTKAPFTLTLGPIHRHHLRGWIVEGGTKTRLLILYTSDKYPPRIGDMERGYTRRTGKPRTYMFTISKALNAGPPEGRGWW